MDMPREVSLLSSFPGLCAEVESLESELNLQAVVRHVVMLHNRPLTVIEQEA